MQVAVGHDAEHGVAPMCNSAVNTGRIDLMMCVSSHFNGTNAGHTLLTAVKRLQGGRPNNQLS